MVVSAAGQRHDPPIEELVRRHHLPAEVVDHIVTKTDGVPLYVEELTKTILESEFLRETDDRYVLAGEISELSIPATLQDSLMARLDRLPSLRELETRANQIARAFEDLGVEKDSIVAIALITSIGVAGIPSASLVAIAIILAAIGLPVEGIGLILAVDRILDIARGVEIPGPTDHEHRGTTRYPYRGRVALVQIESSGTTSSPLCPGSGFNDGVCDSQFLWDVSMHCVTSVESSSWGAIKGLYR